MNAGNAQGSDGGERAAKYADSMDAAAGALGRSISFLQRLKSMGCPAFRGSRVYLDEVEAYIVENNLDALEREVEAAEAINVEIQRERLRKLRFANDVEEGKYIRQERIAEVAMDLGLELKAILQDKLEDQGPDRLTMRTREEVQVIARQIVDEICEKFQRKKWAT